MESTRLLRNHYYRHIGDRRKGEFYHKKTNLYLSQYNAEIKIAGFMDQIIAFYVKDKSDTSHLQQQIDTMVEEAHQLLPPLLNANIIYRLKMLEVTKYMNAYNYAETARVCQEAVEYFQQEKPNFRTYITIFLNQWIISCTQLKQYDQAKALVKQSFNYLDQGEYNWFKAMEYKIQLAFYMRDYTLAFQSYQEVIKHSSLSQLPKVAQEKWRLYEAYAHFANKMGKVSLSAKTGTKPFRIYKFLNNVGTSARDKRGLNIPITIIQACFEISTGKFDRMINRMEALDKYRSRYLKAEKYIRSNIFIKMLVQLIKNDFCPQKASEKVSSHIEELHQYPFNEMTRGHELEIIPYIDLWDLLMEELTKQNSFSHTI